MSSRARKAQRLSQHDTTDSSSKHARSPSENPEYQRRSTEDAVDGDMHAERLEQDFAALGVETYLNVDPRPTFVLDAEANLNELLKPVFINESLRSDPQLSKLLPIKSNSDSPRSSAKVSGSNFKLWIKELAQLEDARLSYSYSGITWTGFVIRRKWIVVCGNYAVLSNTTNLVLPVRSESPIRTLAQQRAPTRSENIQTGPPPRPKKALTTSEDDSHLLNSTGKLETAFVTPGTPDWTVRNPEGDLSPHTLLARGVDWSATPLGDMSSWSREFRQIACLLMANPHPAALFWGEELTVIYNKAYADQVAGEKHPKLMGTGFRGPFAEIWEFVGSIFNEVRRTGHSVAVENQMLPIQRHGFLEETFYTVRTLSYQHSA